MNVNFYGRNFLVTKDVLIPRPESEMIIDAVLNLAGKPYLPGVKPSENKLPEHPKILDVGTGSGCLAITLKLELPEAEVSALDISEKALKIATKNAENLGARVYPLIISDLLANVNFTPDTIPDVVVANLPYVDRTWDWLKLDLEKEPEIALFAEDSGLYLIKKLIRELKNAKIKYLILEADPCQHEAIKKYAPDYHLKHIETRGFILVFAHTN